MKDRANRIEFAPLRWSVLKRDGEILLLFNPFVAEHERDISIS